MSTALENLRANMAQQGMLNTDGNMRRSSRPWMDGLKQVLPGVIPVGIAGDIYNRGGGDSNPVPGRDLSKPASPEQDFRDYWNLDNDWFGNRQAIQGASWLTGAGMLGSVATGIGDKAYGVNPLADFSAMGLANLATRGASSMPEAALRAKGGAWAGGALGNSLIGSTVNGNYISEYTEGIKDSPWHNEATNMGLEQGTPQYDHYINAVSGGLSRNKGVDPEMMNAYDTRGEQLWRNGPISEEPTSVNDFKGMFSGLSNSIGNYFGGSDGYGSMNTSEGTIAGDYYEGGFSKEDMDFATSFDGSNGNSNTGGGYTAADEQSVADEVGVSDY